MMIRWNPIGEMAAMQSAIERVFDETWRNFTLGSSDSTLALDVHETDATYFVVAALPGASNDHIQVSWHDDVLTISGEIPQQNFENSRALMLERVTGKFARSVRLPQPIEVDNVEAVFENGVLTLTLPKTPEVQPRQIPVRTANNN
jgi:HSP20 family protein